MLNTNDILETIQMITDEHLDVRTVTMGISLLDCADPAATPSSQFRCLVIACLFLPAHFASLALGELTV